MPSKPSKHLSTKPEKKKNDLKSKPKSSTKPAVVAPVKDYEWEDEDSDDNEDKVDEDDNGVDEEGMAH